MKKFSVVLALLAVFYAGVGETRNTESKSGESPTTFFTLDANGSVQIGPDGHVSEYRLEGSLQPAVAALVKRAVLNWQFEPIVLDGKPVVAKTAMHIQLRAEPAAGKDDEFSVRVASVAFGNPVRLNAGNPPEYPKVASGQQLGAYVVLSARLDENGKVAEIYPYQTSLDARGGHGRARSEERAEALRREFETAAIAAATTWQYDLTEIVGGHKTGAYVMIPIAFLTSLPQKGRRDRWNGYDAGPIHPAPWTRTQDSDMLAHMGEDATSTSSRFRLRSDVIGKTL